MGSWGSLIARRKAEVREEEEGRANGELRAEGRRERVASIDEGFRAVGSAEHDTTGR